MLIIPWACQHFVFPKEIAALQFSFIITVFFFFFFFFFLRGGGQIQLVTFILFCSQVVTKGLRGRAMRKHVFGHMRTAKAQTSLCIRVIWASLSANRIIWDYRLYEWWSMPRMLRCASAGWSKSLNFKHDQRHCFVWHGPFRLTHCSRETRKRVTGKEYRPRSDATERGVWSGSPLFANSLAIFQ